MAITWSKVNHPQLVWGLVGSWEITALHFFSFFCFKHPFFGMCSSSFCSDHLQCGMNCVQVLTCFYFEAESSWQKKLTCFYLKFQLHLVDLLFPGFFDIILGWTTCFYCKTILYNTVKYWDIPFDIQDFSNPELWVEVQAVFVNVVWKFWCIKPLTFEK